MLTVEQGFSEDLDNILEVANWPEFVRHSFCTFSIHEGCTCNGRIYKFPTGNKMLITNESDLAIVSHEWKDL